MSTHADKAVLTGNDPLDVSYEPDGTSLKNQDKVLSGSDIIQNLGKAVHVKCCPTGTLEYASINSNDVDSKEAQQVHAEECCTAVEASVKALVSRMSLHPPRFLILSGSLREASCSRKVAIEAGRILATYGADVKVFDPTGMPLFSTDIDPSSDPKVKKILFYLND